MTFRDSLHTDVQVISCYIYYYLFLWKVWEQADGILTPNLYSYRWFSIQNFCHITNIAFVFTNTFLPEMFITMEVLCNRQLMKSYFKHGVSNLSLQENVILSKA
jgi:hypothetical protein